jgi:hypothetical protein
MKEVMVKFFKASWQTKLFVLNMAIYAVAIIWTTVQAYARLEYSRSDFKKPIIIDIPQEKEKK